MRISAGLVIYTSLKNSWQGNEKKKRTTNILIILMIIVTSNSTGSKEVLIIFLPDFYHYFQPTRVSRITSLDVQFKA